MKTAEFKYWLLLSCKLKWK